MRAALVAAAVAALAALMLLLVRRAHPPKAPAPGAAQDGKLAAETVTPAPEPLPAWTQRPAEIVPQGSRRVARAVGSARAADLVLARAAAEDKARAAIARLIDGKASVAGVEVAVTGAQVTQTYTAGDGTVYVELTAPVHR
jgi:hypothetical protein